MVEVVSSQVVLSDTVPYGLPVVAAAAPDAEE